MTRPSVLFPLFADITSLPGVGPKVAPLLTRLAGPRVVDLLWHLPTALIDRRHAPQVAEAPPGRVATLTVRVDAHHPPAQPRHPYRVICSDTTGFISLIFFHGRAETWQRLLPIGSTRVVSGTVDIYGAERQMAHPDYIVDPANESGVPAVEQVYPLTAGLMPKTLMRIIGEALARTPALAEWQDPSLMRREGWPSWRDAIGAAHAPAADGDLQPLAPARARLAYDELLANQLALGLVRHHMQRSRGRSLRAQGRLADRALAQLPFRLTAAQEPALAEIRADMAGPNRMLRLLQGDVGSGKTVVAVLAMLDAVETGAQAALMAPTEILARQHMATLQPLAEAAGVTTALLTGRDKGRGRDAILEGLAAGTVGIVIGTHSLFQEAVAFHDLALAVIDEQHRFGVHQRLDLARKGRSVDVLVTTATPIPRTLMLTAYGDMDASRLTEKPPGRQRVDTRTLPLDRLEEVVAAVGRSIRSGGQVFWVCPLVTELEVLDVAAAEERFQHLSREFGPKVGLLHGRMRGPDRDAVMAAVAEGTVSVLVATTVIEVGVDVPAATVMVIEHAERFGLAQLHQLRGRIGRGDRPSTCLLLYQPPLSTTARARLAILRETDDGFRIAEEDLRLRGAGEMLGTRQSGLPEFRLADLDHHEALLATARDDAKLILDRDPDLVTGRGQALRTLLYLFERDAGIRYLRSG
ncbi:MAG: ATP-dependent DNA helicase RecG [Rhodospirillales bacterium]|nr:MAG: ATP-dependent DNA helicase RecG [Rhodospirillales bacterium]